MSVLATALAFLGEHLDILEAIYKAIAAGASKESIKAAVRQVEIEASDAVAREELGLPPK